MIGLNLSGYFEIGLGLQTMAGDVGGGRQDAEGFGTGVLAVVVAAPCTAPFMGAALGYAVTQPMGVTLLVFGALGAGMAAPVVALTQMPSLLSYLPRPGPWMVKLKEFLAFPDVWLGAVASLGAGEPIGERGAANLGHRSFTHSLADLAWQTMA